MKADYLPERFRMKMRTLVEQREKAAGEAVENFSAVKKRKRVSK